MKLTRTLAVLVVLLAAERAHARPVEDGTRITLFAGGRYVPRKHFEQLAAASGDPVLSSQPIGPAALASFSYAPQSSLELSLEVGYASDKYTLQNGPLTMINVPVVASLRYMPFAGWVDPYIGAGAGYMLGFVGGAAAGDEKDSHSQELHALIGVALELSPSFWLNLEDRESMASGDVIPIGQIQTGGNTFMLGLSIILEPAKDTAPH